MLRSTVTPSIKKAARSNAVKNLRSVIKQWESWQAEVEKIIDQPYDRNMQTEVFADGEDMMERHDRLQAKTLSFLNATFNNHGFLTGLDGSHIDRTDLRLKYRVKHRLHELRILASCLEGLVMEETVAKTQIDEAEIWKSIEEEYGETKREFGKKVAFVTDKYIRKVLFRDVAHAAYLANQGLAKPAVILAGGVIEELLRQYLISKGRSNPGRSFNEYIRKCETLGLLKKAIHKLSDSVREFRNIVHVELETSKKVTISKATAKGAVSAIITVANDLMAI